MGYQLDKLHFSSSHLIRVTLISNYIANDVDEKTFTYLLITDTVIKEFIKRHITEIVRSVIIFTPSYPSTISRIVGSATASCAQMFA